MNKNEFSRFLNLLSAGEEKELVILKGHLLLEEVLGKMVESKLKKVIL